VNDSSLIIDVNHLSKSFQGKPAVINVSLQVNRGEIFGFLGPNGSGKTTTIRMLCGLLTPDGGSGTCMGYDILTQSKFIKQHLGYIPQFFSLYKPLSVFENLILMAELYGVKNKVEKIEHIMEQLGLTAKKNQVSGTLSGGWKQRLALAAALIHDPFLLLLDEPTASVDPKSRSEFWELMQILAAEGMTILLSSHNMDEVGRCDRIAYINNGLLLMEGNIDKIIRNINLTTWSVKGSNLLLLAKQLKAMPDVEQVIIFFDRLNVSSRDANLLEKAISPYTNNPHFSWQKIETSLDDIFVWLSENSPNA
jgi:ABC-2 type transport system ATP-binding protein